MPIHLPIMSPYFESHHNTALHQASIIYTSLHYSYWHFTSTKFLFTFLLLGWTHFQFHVSWPSFLFLFTALFFAYHLTHFTHHFTEIFIRIYSPLPFPFYHRYFPSLVNTVLILFLKICDLPWESLITSSGSWFQSAIALFTKEYIFNCSNILRKQWTLDQILYLLLKKYNIRYHHLWEC